MRSNRPRVARSLGSPSVYRFALRPRWILSHLFAVVMVVLFVNLGFWQLRRHDWRAERNAAVVARSEEPVVPVEELVDAAVAQGLAIDDLQFRPVSVVGSFDGSSTVLVDNRSRDGLPGVWVLTTLELADGARVVVNRGFHSTQGSDDIADPPAGRVEMVGSAVPWDSRSCGVRDGGEGDIVGMACLRRDVVEDRVGGSVLDVVVQRTSASADDAAGITPVPPPELDSGPHRGYAFQWMTFATLTAVVYALILRRVARDRSREAPVADAGHDG